MFKNLSLAQKLAVGFGVVLCALAVVGVIGVVNITGVRTVVGDLTETHIPLMQHVSEIDAAATGQELALMKLAFHGDAVFLEKYKNFNKTVDEEFTAIEEIIKNDEQLVAEGWDKDAETIAASHDSFTKACEIFADSIQKNAP